MIKNNFKNKRMFFSFSGKHFVHYKFAECFTNEEGHVDEGFPKGYDIYFSEAKFFKILIYKFFSKINRKSKIITLFSDPRLFYLNEREMWDRKSKTVKKYPLFKYLISKFFIRFLDGAICVGDFEGKLFRSLNKKIPMRTVYPFVLNKVYNSLIDLKPKLRSQNIVFIGNGPDYHYKGLDLLVESFKLIKNEFPLAKLTIVGEWEPKPEWIFEDINFVGKQKDLKKYLQSADLYLHLGRGEAFGVSILEAMLAGVPSIVSEKTGAKCIVSKAGDWIVPLDSKIVASKVLKYFRMKTNEKLDLSRKMRAEAKKLNENDMLILFKKEFNDLLGEIYGKNIDLSK